MSHVPRSHNRCRDAHRSGTRATNLQAASGSAAAATGTVSRQEAHPKLMRSTASPPALLLAAAAALLQTLTQASAAAPPAPPGYAAIPELSDEFESGALDASKWDLDTSRWRGRQPGLFDPANVLVADGHLQLWARAAKRNESWPEGFDNFTTSTVRSFAAVKGGYFEIRWRSGSSGISSSWWFTGGNDTTGRVEIDVFETTGVDDEPAGGGDPESPDWCSTTPLGHCRTGCPADPHGRCGPDKKPFPPGGPSCNECPCNRQNTTCSSEMKNTNLPSHVHIWALPDTPLSGLPAKCGCIEGNKGKAPCSKGSTATLATPVSTEFHTASLNWTETEITVAVDGEVVNTISSPCMVADIQVRAQLLSKSASRLSSRSVFCPRPLGSRLACRLTRAVCMSMSMSMSMCVVACADALRPRNHGQLDENSRPEDAAG
jgi:beta-glucanase (GH16 family)